MIPLYMFLPINMENYRGKKSVDYQCQVLGGRKIFLKLILKYLNRTASIILHPNYGSRIHYQVEYRSRLRSLNFQSSILKNGSSYPGMDHKNVCQFLCLTRFYRQVHHSYYKIDCLFSFLKKSLKSIFTKCNRNICV